MNGLGRAIAIHRVANGLTRTELAGRAGISYPYLSEIENGHKEPRLDTLRQIAVALGLAPSRLLADAERVDRGESLIRG